MKINKTDYTTTTHHYYTKKTLDLLSKIVWLIFLYVIQCGATNSKLIYIFEFHFYLNFQFQWNFSITYSYSLN